LPTDYIIGWQIKGKKRKNLDILTYLHEKTTFQSWPELEELVSCIINEKPRHVDIPGLIADCCTPSSEKITAVSSSLALAFSGIIILDDILDGDLRFGDAIPGLANMSAVLFSLAYRQLDEAILGPPSAQKARKTLDALLYNVSLGQAIDVQNPDTEEDYWRVAQLKSGSFFEGAFKLGGIAGEASDADLELLGKLGLEYGIMLQIHDDLRDTLEIPADSDWLNGRFTLPILFAYTVDHPWKERFNVIRQSVDQPELLTEAQEILVRCGALSYGLYQVQEHAKQVKTLIAKLECQDQGELRKLFDELIHPAEDLVNLAMG
jgi:geranylgeranyl pyrophosphate synthase